MVEEESMAASTLYRWAEIEPEQMNPLVTRQYVVGEKTMLARICLLYTSRCV